MNVPSLPTGYHSSKHVGVGRTDCHLTVGFDLERAHIPRFLVQLHYQVQDSTGPVHWLAIARMDHNEASASGHDVYREGPHVDVVRRSMPTAHLQIPHAGLPANRGALLRGCVDYLRHGVDYFVDVYEERREPGTPPRWSVDGGDSTPMLISASDLTEGMSREVPEEEVLTVDELTELLAEVTGTTPEEIERGAAELDLALPWEAEIVEE